MADNRGGHTTPENQNDKTIKNPDNQPTSENKQAKQREENERNGQTAPETQANKRS